MSDIDIVWYNENLEMLIERYAGQYVAIDGGKLIGHGTAEEAYNMAKSEGAEIPLILKVPVPGTEPRNTITGL